MWRSTSPSRKANRSALLTSKSPAARRSSPCNLATMAEASSIMPGWRPPSTSRRSTKRRPATAAAAQNQRRQGRTRQGLDAASCIGACRVVVWVWTARRMDDPQRQELGRGGRRSASVAGSRRSGAQVEYDLRGLRVCHRFAPAFMVRRCRSQFF